MTLVFGSDHAGFEFRQELARRARDWGHTVEEVGAESTDAYDYPFASDAVAMRIVQKTADFGVLVCGSGIGVCIRANRYRGVRAANVCTAEMAELARLHNDANVLCLGARLVSIETAEAALQKFLATETAPEERHRRRVQQLDGN